MKPYLIILITGPIHNEKDSITGRAEALSKYFDGEIWTFGSIERDMTIGDFKFRCIRTEHNGGLFASVKFAREAFPAIIANSDKRKGRKVAILSYDPLNFGVVSAILAFRMKTRLMVEFPGSYGNKHSFADIANPLRRAIALQRIKMMARLVGWRSNLVRLIYPGQLKGIMKPPRKAVITEYFDMTMLDRLRDAKPISSNEIKPEDKIILSAGYPYYRKGMDILIEAWMKIEENYPQWKLALMGHRLDDHIPQDELESGRIMFFPPMNNEK
jgi:glycosyltransferase involved in cell wall biosynthesis